MEENYNIAEQTQNNGQFSYIKVIGVGGGGCNAVNHMFRQGIKDVDFIVCNTDIKALNASPVPEENKIVLGSMGLGAGGRPERAQRAAEQQSKEIRAMLENKTKMLFITAGMGGGTGTGAAPVIAKVAKDIELKEEDTKRILVVAVVTTPFTWEGPGRLRQAEEGIKTLRDTVDSMIVINNDKIRSLGGNLDLTEGFAKANNVLFEAVKGISDIITGNGIVNRDFQDVNFVMAGSGRALMGSGVGQGEDRASEAVTAASTSSLLNDSDITGAQNMLLYFYFNREHVITMDELEEVTNYLRSISRNDELNIIFGAGYDDNLNDELHIILIATSLENKTQQIEAKPVTVIAERFDTEDPMSALEPTRQTTEKPAEKPAEAPQRRILTLDDDFTFEPIDEPEVEPVAKVEAKPIEILDVTLDEPKLEEAPIAHVEKEKVETLTIPEFDFDPQPQPTPVVEKPVDVQPATITNDFEDIFVQTQKPAEQRPVDTTPQRAEPFAFKPMEPTGFKLSETPIYSATERKPEPVKVMPPVFQNTDPKPTPSRVSEPQSIDINMVQKRADRVKHLYDLLHNHPNGPQMVEEMSVQQLTDDVIYETPHSSVSDAPKTKVDANGMVIPVNNYLFNAAD